MSGRAKLPQHRRVLFAGALPTALRDPGCNEALLDLVALVVREHVLPWYGKLSRDRSFLTEDVVRIVTHVVGELERRVEAIDLAELVLVDVPEVLRRHYADWQTATERGGSTYAAGLDTAELFCSLQPHVGIELHSASPHAKLPFVRTAYLSALVDGILRECLPPADYAAETERTIVRDVITYIVLGGVFAKVAQPWFINQAVARVLRTGRLVSAPAKRADDDLSADLSARARNAAARAWARLTLLFGALATIIGSLRWTERSSTPDLALPAIRLAATVVRADQRPLISFVFALAETISGLGGSYVDRLLRNTLARTLFSPAGFVKILQLAQDGLLPGGHPAPSLPDPTVEEQEALRAAAEAAIADIAPDALIRFLMPGDGALRPGEALACDILDPWSSHPANCTTILVILDLVLGRLFPELVA